MNFSAFGIQNWPVASKYWIDASKPHIEAANAAVEEHNAAAKSFKDQQDALLQ